MVTYLFALLMTAAEPAAAPEAPAVEPDGIEPPAAPADVTSTDDPFDLMALAGTTDNPFGEGGTDAKPAAAPPPPAAPPAVQGKLAPAVGKEMTEVIVAVNKSLGLESWPTRGVQPCVDRGGQGITTKNVGPDEARKCVSTAIDKAFPGLGKSYVLAIPMATIGPVTVIALGTGEAHGWAAYSCDPERKCAPVKLSAPSKWGKRIAERQAKACADPATLWFPADQRVCPPSS